MIRVRALLNAIFWMADPENWPPAGDLGPMPAGALEFRRPGPDEIPLSPPASSPRSSEVMS